jgi:hypothetical protein
MAGELLQELPRMQSVIRVDSALVAVIVQLRDCVHQLETAQILSSLSGGACGAPWLGGIIGGLNEPPEAAMAEAGVEGSTGQVVARRTAGEPPRRHRSALTNIEG